MKIERLKIESIINKAVARKESAILNKWLEARNYKFCKTNLTTAHEAVEFYSVKIYTVRYCGQLVFRRFPDGIDGYKYEINIAQ
ncbi:hypothetical protein MWN41_05400 [Ornithobacterium rhinotracheale]|uniref:hypothetical protein n=1 Tax=Ornithobacterium rhinotracheale TaxID=28251 RepID=UPI001FF657E7|nr:hypothetical protein [Ornithobacterium rhinotracheale]MCK0202454.1 hypothetical protein [Ornithobacterium rhinotracheale]